MKILIGIPAYNEEKIIGSVIKKCRSILSTLKYPSELVVVDDGSEDLTAKIVRDSHSHLVSHIINRGLGGVIKTLFLVARKRSANVLITLDADGQHEPSDIPRILEPVLRNRADVVIASRWLKNSNAPLSRKFINKCANFLTTLMFSIPTTDSQSGFRAFGPAALKTINLRFDGMEVSSEVFREIVRNRLRYQEIAIKPTYTSYSLQKGQKLSNFIHIIWNLFIRLIQ